MSIDDLPWRWADAGDNGAVVVNGLPAGLHKMLIELATPRGPHLEGDKFHHSSRQKLYNCSPGSQPRSLIPVM